MYIVVTFSIIAVFLTYLESIGKLNAGMKCGFVLMAFLGAIHYDYGNDYMSYLRVYEECTSIPFDLSAILAKEVYREPGWVLLCWAFKYLGGFFSLVAVLNIIQNIVIYRFIKREVQSNWWPLAMFIYLFSTGFYLMSFSMMRQEFVMVVFLGLWKYIKERKWLFPLFVLYLCSFVHSSAIVLLPFSFWGFVPIRKGKLIGLFFVCILLVLWLLKDTLNNIFQYALNLDEGFSDYATTYGEQDNSIHIGLGFIVNMIPLVLAVFFMFQNKACYSSEQKLLVSIATASFLITPFAQIIPIVGRIGMYFAIFNIGAIPLIYGNVRNNICRLFFLSLFILMTLYDYFLFFNSAVWRDKYTVFHTIFSQIF